LGAGYEAGCGVDGGRGGERNWQESSGSIRPSVPLLCLARTGSPQRSGPQRTKDLHHACTYLWAPRRRPLSCRQSCELITVATKRGGRGRVLGADVLRGRLPSHSTCTMRVAGLPCEYLFLGGTPMPGTYATMAKFQERGIVGQPVAGQRSLMWLTWPHWVPTVSGQISLRGKRGVLLVNNIAPPPSKPCSFSHGVSCC